MKFAVLSLVFLIVVIINMSEVTCGTVEEEYDFVIVGGGNTGCVVASRLSEDPNVKVLLLEAGGSGQDEPRIRVPNKAFFLEGTDLDWNYTTTPQEHGLGYLPDRSGKFVAGKVLGGSSSLNYMLYTRGSRHDYDSWEDHGAQGWNFESVEPIFHKIENAKEERMGDNLGRNGILPLTRNYLEDSDYYKIVASASGELGIQEGDYNDNLETLSHVTRNVYKGMRQSASDAYLTPIIQERRDRLHIVTDAHVTKILTNEEKQAYGVQYIKEKQEYTARATKEIILSAGAFGTPNILKLSGIGPQGELESFDISVVHNLPGVGSNLQTHYVVISDIIMHNIDQITNESIDAEALFKEGKGPLVEAKFLNLAGKTELFGTDSSLSTEKQPFPEITVIFDEMTTPEKKLQIRMYLLISHPKSRGSLNLSSNDPNALPKIELNMFSKEDDFKMQIAALRLMEKFEISEAFQKAGAEYQTPKACEEKFPGQAAPRSDEFYRCVIKETAAFFMHACGTAKMGKDDDKDAVLDSNLRVRGIGNLRVADASVMPHITTSNLQAPCFMIGEKVAEMIKETWNLL